MPAMTVEEIQAALAQNAQTPNGPVKVARAEYLADAAEATGDGPVCAQALLDVVNAYEYGAEQSKLLVPFARLLGLWDSSPASFDTVRRHSLFWYFKWATGGMLRVPEVPLASIERWLDEMESRYRQAGFSARPVHMGRHRLAWAAGDAAAAAREFESWIDAPRDAMADCHACEAGNQGSWQVSNERYEEALAVWDPVLSGRLVCAEEPHRVLGYSLLPLLRLGRVDEARANHLHGYRLVRGVPNLRSTIARHIEFCALTGNEARGLELLTEHASLLATGAEDATSRLDFLAGSLVLLRRLIALGLCELPLTTADPALARVGTAAAVIERRVAALGARFDARNGSTTVSGAVARRLAAEPLLDSLPLGGAVRLPPRAAAPAPGRSASALGDAAAVAARDSGTGAGTGTGTGTGVSTGAAARVASLEELVAHAEQLGNARHPQAHRGWERVAASGYELPAAVSARVDRARARTLMGRDPAAARAAFTAIAERFARLGEETQARETRSNAAFAAFLAGDAETAQTEAIVITAEAEAAYAAGDLTARQYLTARSLPVYLAFNAFIQGDVTAAERAAAVADVLRSELAITQRLGDPGRAAGYHLMMAQLALFNDPAEARARLEAARDSSLSAQQPWDAVEPEELLAQLALRDGDPVAAESHGRQALAYGADLLDVKQRARLYSLLTEAMWQQPDRELDVVDAALRAGELWEGLSEPDALHSRFLAARTYAGMKRYGEAAALFDELIPRVHLPYDEAGVAMTREQYADCLTRLGEHRRAAEQYLTAAKLVQDDPRNRLPHARLAWSAAQALQSAGLVAEALPAYRRAAQLWGGLGNLPARARCLRSAAWLLGFAETPQQPEQRDAPARWRSALTAMRTLLDELAAVPEEERSEQVKAEIGYTTDQLDQMAGYLHEAERQEGEPGKGAVEA